MNTALRLLERGYVPKPLVRRGIRKLLDERLREQGALYAPDRERALRAWVETMRSSPVAPVPEKANEQHYELPPEFFHSVLGARLKYSSAYYPRPDTTLDQAEEHMLALTCRRAQLEDDQNVLELGCGWGSLTLWMAQRYPNSHIHAVSNSAPQREFILKRASERGLSNVTVETCDMNEFDTLAHFDRVVSVEMFEHMRNWEALLQRVRGWLKDDGRVFLHVFAHKEYAYPFEVRDESDWMSRYFFTGGMMPSPPLVEALDVPFDLDQSWIVPGTHYARTAEDWLSNLELRRNEVREIFAPVYGEDQVRTWYHRWRVFFLACAELFGYGDGEEWFVYHLRLAPQDAAGSSR